MGTPKNLASDNSYFELKTSNNGAMCLLILPLRTFRDYSTASFRFFLMASARSAFSQAISSWSAIFSLDMPSACSAFNLLRSPHALSSDCHMVKFFGDDLNALHNNSDLCKYHNTKAAKRDTIIFGSCYKKCIAICSMIRLSYYRHQSHIVNVCRNILKPFLCV